MPLLLGETGIPFDLHNSNAYTTHDFSVQIEAMDSIINACERNLLSYTLWNYSPSNTHEHGDFWNREDLSIWSRDDSKRDDERSNDYDCRAMPAICRPYARAVAGIVTSARFSLKKKQFLLKFKQKPAPEGVDENDWRTEICLPQLYFPNANLDGNLCVNVKSNSKTGRWQVVLEPFNVQQQPGKSTTGALAAESSGPQQAYMQILQFWGGVDCMQELRITPVSQPAPNAGNGNGTGSGRASFSKLNTLITAINTRVSNFGTRISTGVGGFGTRVNTGVRSFGTSVRGYFNRILRR